jgi:hypothetical protein
MRTALRRAAVVSGALAIAAPLLAAPGQAQPRQDPREICGRGFHVVDDRGGIDGRAQRRITHGNRTYGHVYLLYNNRTRQNCVVAVKSAYRGKRTRAAASLEVRNGPSATDKGSFRYYAGPVKLHAGSRCVRYMGWMKLRNGKYAVGGRDRWGNCRR